ncbi:hypothetical protein JKF63_07126 [Porcisia hertigi]|uniref:Basic immunoglobulin-like variable motif-containing protein n=1 Tax=Porcisia hertigi TaxID=2761500 RepID=A0A837AY98_9TRYP|nr:hypothetical protein JKF63_07126 [Porcisia hertigi]
MEQRCADLFDTAGAGGITAGVADGAPNTTPATSQVSQTVDLSARVCKEHQVSSGEGGSSSRHKVRQVFAISPACVSSFDIQPTTPQQLNMPIGIAMEPEESTAVNTSSLSAALTENEAGLRTSPVAGTALMESNPPTAAALHDDDTPVASWISSTEGRLDTGTAAGGDSRQLQQQSKQSCIQQVDNTASRLHAESSTAAAAVADSQAWLIDFSPAKPRPTRKMSKKERDTIEKLHLRSRTAGAGASTTMMGGLAVGGGTGGAGGLGADSEGNAVVTLGASTSVATGSSHLQVVHLDTLAVDRDALIPRNLATTRADLEKRLVLRLPRLLCVNKQYPRSCGIASLTSVYNYLYSWLGESAVGADRAPHSQEEIMSILGFEPPFGEIMWGSFTGNATLIRWFHALNRHFGLRGRAYILYKAHGSSTTSHLYANDTEALAAVKAALRDPHCALIYHCYNHYMVPLGYQDIPLAQTDFLKPTVAESNCETTIFIGEVSRGRHEAMYARKWSQIVKDIECKSPFFYNIRKPEAGVQRRVPNRKLGKEAADKGCDTAGPDATTVTHNAAAAAAATPVEETTLHPAGQQDGKQCGNDSTPATLLVPPSPSAPLCSAVTEVRDVIASIGVDVPEDGASSGTCGTVEVQVFGAAIKPTQPSKTPVLSSQLHTPHPSAPTSSRGVSTIVVPEPEFFELPEDSGSDSFLTTVRHPQALVEREVAVTHLAPSRVANVDAYPRATLAPRLDTESPGAPLAESAMSSAKRLGLASVQSLPLQSSLLPPPPPPSDASRAVADNAAEVRHPQPLLPSSAKPKKEGGNLHCIICFRNDEVEPCMERYEDVPDWLPRAAAASPLSSGSSSSKCSSSSGASDVCDHLSKGIVM